MTAALLALLSSVLWGSADYLGGVLSRTRAAIQVVALSQAISLVVVGLAVVLTGAAIGSTAVVWGMLAGLAGGTALICFYAALAAGTMGVVAPISALGLVVPVLAGLLAGERPSVLQLIGIAVAVAGVVLASGPELSGGASARPLLLAATAGFGFGFTLLFLAQSDDTLPTLAMMRVASVGLLSVVLLALWRTTGVPVRINVRAAPALGFVGIADLGANGLYAVAATSGLLSVVAVLASLYPAVTVILAWRFGRERLGGLQQAGVGAALVGVVLLAAG
ncbi:MAG: DMT family transporter [Geodermatophilaceae bacterium]|nr:DMT family transporter [Geodermatophilaceae bacterium]